MSGDCSTHRAARIALRGASGVENRMEAFFPRLPGTDPAALLANEHRGLLSDSLGSTSCELTPPLRSPLCEGVGSLTERQIEETEHTEGERASVGARGVAEEAAPMIS